MNKWGKNIFLFLLGVGIIGGGLAFLVAAHLSPHSKQKLSAFPATMKWKTFQAENPPFNFTFEYPELWKVKTNRFAGRFDMVGVLGSQEKKTRFVVAVFVAKQSLPSGKTAEQLAEDSLSKKKGFPKFEMLNKKGRKENSGIMFGVEYQYVSMLPLYAPQRQTAIIRNQELFIIKNNFFYRISFAGTEDQYKTFLPVFEHVLETFQFKE